MGYLSRTRRTLFCLSAAAILLLLLRLRSASSLQLNDDVLGLIVFKADLDDPKNALRLWSEEDDSPCNWTGIVCDTQSGRVVSVKLDGLSLSGHIGRGLEKLEYLQALSLSNNNFSGSIDAELARLPGLQRLDFSHNLLSGSITPSFGNLSSLKVLDLSCNVLSGPIPSDLFNNCQDLRYLSLAKNALQGPLPDSIGVCSSLQTLNISNNFLDDAALPASMHALTALSELDVSYNIISGNLPAFLPSLVNLVDVRLQSNKFSGTMPDQLGNCILLEHLDLSNNFISSGIPDSLQRLSSLSFLNLANNFHSGSFPSWIGNLSSLKTLSLRNNLLYGEIPSTLGLLKELETADLSHNRLSGSIPSSLSGCTQLKSLDLSSNNFINSVPAELLIPSLLTMQLSNNELSGQLSDRFNNQCGSLHALDLSQNRIRGPLPLIGTCEKMEYFNLSGNVFSGKVPAFRKGNALIVLDLSHNQLTDKVPASLGYANVLSTLLLHGNNLTGSIPSELGSCAALTSINLSKNIISGSIPQELGNLTGLQELDLSYNNISGSLPPDLGQLQRLAFFNVSYNKLEGPIPDNGIFERFNQSTFVGNDNLCGADVNVTCPSVMPKPIVLNPNSSDANPIESNPLTADTQHRHIVLSASAILAICAAVAISTGVVVVFLLNIHAHSLPRLDSHYLESLSHSPSSEFPSGKLVMFTRNSDPRAEEWVTSAHALLNKDSELGRGGFGTVYKAVLADGRTVAIKKLMVSSVVKSQEEFEKEIQYLGKIKHRNLLGLQGYYWTHQLQLLIYDFVPNGNLFSRLHEKSYAYAPLSWSNRFQIALGTARGLAHLHHGCHPQVVHYNMKSSNVLVDEDGNPKIADYGLANLLPMLDRYLMSSKFQNALGYMAPEFASKSSKINEKCDVYGYGVMLLELVTGRRPVEYMEEDVVILCDYVRALLDEGIALSCVDPRMSDYAEDEVLPLIKLGLICTSQVPSNRPSMAEVVQILELVKTPGNSRDLL